MTVRGKSRRARRKRTLLRRDGRACAYCGRQFGTGLAWSRPTVDHRVPLSRGGSNTLENLVLACKRCNRAKADRPVEDFLAAGAQA